MPRKHVIFLWVFLVGLVLDQATKIAVYTQLEPITAARPGRVVIIPGFLDIIHAQNPGAAFSFLAGFEYRYLVFLGFTVLAMAFVITQQRVIDANDRWRATSLALIAGGAVGNAIDRVHKRTVTDFVRMYLDVEPARSWLVDMFGTYEWPTYNVADALLFFGIVILVVMGDPQAAEADDKRSPDAPSDDADNPVGAGSSQA